jgi:hypothetical protein
MMPRGFRALLSAGIRTDPEPKPGTADALMGFLPLQSVPRMPWRRLPASFPRALSAPPLRETRRPALQGLAEHTSRRPLAGPPALLRFTTRTLSSAFPAKKASRRLPDRK